MLSATIAMLSIGGCQAFAPADLAALQAAVDSCVGSTGDGSACDSSSYGPIGDWDVSQVPSLNYLFGNKKVFNQDISKWDVSQVTDMTQTFLNAEVFQSDISAWDASKVTLLHATFRGAKSFNSDLSNWDVSKVTNFDRTFLNCYAFNSDLSNWDTSSVTIVDAMFFGTQSFDQDLSKWDMSSVTSKSYFLDWANDLTKCTMASSSGDMFQGCTHCAGSNCGDGMNCKEPLNVGYFTCACGPVTVPNPDWTSGVDVPFDPDTPPCLYPPEPCDTLDPTTGCQGAQYTGALVLDASSKMCAGQCGAVDAATCCEPKASCATLSASDASLSSVCVVPIYTGALVAVPATINCAGATCGAADAATCCERAEIVDFSEHEKGTLKKLLANLAQPNHHQADLLKVRYEKLACASAVQVDSSGDQVDSGDQAPTVYQASTAVYGGNSCSDVDDCKAKCTQDSTCAGITTTTTSGFGNRDTPWLDQAGCTAITGSLQGAATNWASGLPAGCSRFFENPQYNTGVGYGSESPCYLGTIPVCYGPTDVPSYSYGPETAATGGTSEQKV